MKKPSRNSLKRASVTALAIVVIAVIVAAPIFAAFPSQNVQTVRGDAAPVFLGGVNIRPYSENSITLQKEDLTINFKPTGDYTEEYLTGTAVHVSATFTFVNTGKKVSLKMGFPFGLAKMRGFNTPNVQNVSVEMDGKKITPNFLTTENGKYDPWIYFNAEFKANETKTLKVTYDAMPAGGYFLYVLKTGAMWKGPIGELNIDLKFPYSASYPNVLSVTPEGYTEKGNDIIYHLKNYEPDENINVEFLPYGFYKKIMPLREKAEKTNGADDWFNYARALFPKNPLGELQKFAFFYKTCAYEYYVTNVLNRAISLQKEGSANYTALKPIYNAHFATKDQFYKGYDILIDGRSSKVLYTYFPDRNLESVKNDIESLKGTEEHNVIQELLEYAILYQLEENNLKDALSVFNTLLNTAGKNDTGSFAIPWSLIYGTDPKSGAITPKEVAPLFTECFVPSVQVRNSMITIIYPLPCSTKGVLREIVIRSAGTSTKPYELHSTIKDYPALAYVVSIAFDANDEKEFDSAKKQITEDLKKASETSNGDGREYAYNLLDVYISDILNNLSIKNGRIVANAPYVDCTAQINSAIKKINGETKPLLAAIEKYKHSSFVKFIENVQAYYTYNENLLEKANTRIVFTDVPGSTQNTTTPPHNTHKENAIIFALAAAVLALIAVLALVLIKSKK